VNRRDFLKTGAAITAATACPALAADEPVFTAEGIKSAMAMLMDNAAMVGQSSYFVFMHPEAQRDLASMLERERWVHAYRAYRVARHEQVMLACGPREILRRFGKASLLNARGEVGCFDGIQIITTKPMIERILT